jgi:23S rRNA (cytosine1962-C5)-methyltransferase
MNRIIPGYLLLDSGDGEKLEQFGSKIVRRPSSLSTWRKRQPAKIWDSADATYQPPDTWRYSGARFTSAQVTVQGVTLEIDLMSNGQVGIFPEHALYLPLVAETMTRLRHKKGRPLRLLNLFAYTGLATMFCAMQGDDQVTHVDLAKRAIESAKKNASANSLSPDRIRWIVDDALAFMAREHRKQSYYDVIIIDPPSFSRISKNNSWTLEEKAPEMVSLVLSALEPEGGVVFFTNHASASTSDVARNIALDTFNDAGVEIDIKSLALKEKNTERLLPAGSLIVLSHSVAQHGASNQ